MTETNTATPSETEFEQHGGRGRVQRRVLPRDGPLFGAEPAPAQAAGVRRASARGRRDRVRGRREPPLSPGRRHARRDRTEPLHARRGCGLRPRSQGVRLDLRERMAEQTGLPDDSVDTVDLVARALLGAGSGRGARRDPAHPAPGRHVPLRRARGRRRRDADPRRAADPPPSVGVDLRGLLVRTRPGAVACAPPDSRASTSSTTGCTRRSCRSTPTSPASRGREDHQAVSPSRRFRSRRSAARGARAST